MAEVVQLAYGSGTVTGRPVVVTTSAGLPTTPYSGGAALFPTAAAAADAFANPTTTGVLNFLMGFNGTTWNRLRTMQPVSDDGLSGSSTLAVGLILADGSANRRWLTVSTLGDGQTGGYFPAIADYVYNGSTYDRLRNNTEGTLLDSAARTATTASADQTNYNAKGVRIFINATASAATPSVVFTIEVKDPVSAKYTAVATSAAITGAGHTVVTVYPGITAAANVSISHVLGRTWRVTATAADADSLTYSVGYSYIL